MVAESAASPLKSREDMGAFAERLASARTVAKHPRIKVRDIERRVGGTVYTSECVAWLVRRAPRARFVWLMGADNLRQFDSWYHWSRITATPCPLRFSTDRRILYQRYIVQLPAISRGLGWPKGRRGCCHGWRRRHGFSSAPCAIRRPLRRSGQPSARSGRARGERPSGTIDGRQRRSREPERRVFKECVISKLYDRHRMAMLCSI